MNDEQRRRHERFQRVRSFCESLPQPFPADSRAAVSQAAIAAAIERTEELDASQSTHKRKSEQGTARRRELRERLRAQLSAIGKTARIIGKENEALRDRFKLSGSRGNDQALLSTARAFHVEAIPFKNLFLEYNMPPDFLEMLSATITLFEEAVNQQTTGAGARTQARAEIDQIQEQATGNLENLDTAMRNRFRDDKATLTAWESASRLERAPRSAPTDEESGESN